MSEKRELFFVKITDHYVKPLKNKRAKISYFVNANQIKVFGVMFHGKKSDGYSKKYYRVSLFGDEQSRVDVIHEIRKQDYERLKKL